MTAEVSVNGHVAPGFEGVRQAFEDNFRVRGDVGASVAVYVDGAPVVDLWGGVADPTTGRAWGPDTTTLVYSATKGATAILVHALAEAGALDLDAPVATYWPEFAEGGKAAVTVRMLLSHQAGLPVPTAELTREDLFAGSPVAAALAAQEPLWEPGTAHGYHALTYGWLLGELVRRVTGRSLGAEFAERVAAPLKLDLWIGVPQDADVDYAPLLDGVPDPAALDAIEDPTVKAAIMQIVGAMMDPTSLFARVLSTNGALPTPHAETWNDPRARHMEQPAANGVTNARSLARMYAATVNDVDGVRLLSEATVEAARAEQVFGPDRVLMSPSRFGSGFMLDHAGMPLLSPASFGHQGAGGALGFADVEHRVGFGYAQNQLGASLVGEPRTAALIDALRASLG
ncbi:serine hydrolase domain-containing protein [Geodermatophilus sabuli]|uniref:CubicO group peptidase, beta-lactamase class C family n=1 Tax=Geodermatophilus sabuli TaxID=1564158 RepID=A0A285E9J0_9ACTN|nr:serine hydrolase domain-containing protein [Geodermatophilus sabuli]MBB3082399.1 CubicO group peptidase (beta-lactamase class C family) [Geodermatophilus sabuli]SNX94731.1 CubicO group peptidase, beta-lactamase class C family [Geodermatophilus sabuli]